jgi:hypothetical protein
MDTKGVPSLKVCGLDSQGVEFLDQLSDYLPTFQEGHRSMDLVLFFISFTVQLMFMIRQLGIF